MSMKKNEENANIEKAIISDAQQSGQPKRFYITLTFSQILGVTALILTAVLLKCYLGGFDTPAVGGLNFNFHPLFMVLGMVFLYGEGMITYRVLRKEKKLALKIIHFAFMAACIILLSIGLKAVFDSHNNAIPPIANVYSAHSWFGIITVALFACQILLGFLAFLVPGLRAPVRGAYLTWHTTFGVIIFVMAIISCLTGITEKALFSVQNYGNLPPAAYLINFLSLTIFAFGCSIVYMVVNPEFRRIPLPEE